jgi:Undecaprenyl-phosphate galactose phosphotransferase WbaP
MQTTYESSNTATTIVAPIKELPRLGVIPHSRVRMTAWLMLADLLALAAAGLLAFQTRLALGANLPKEDYYILAPMLGLFIVGYLMMGLYPGVGINPIQEIKRVSYANTVMTVFLTALFFLQQSGLRYSRLMFLFFWIFILIIAPLARMLARKLGVRYHFWGEPVALIGFGPQGKHVYQYLQNNPTYGIKPVVIVNGVEAEEVDRQASGTLEIPITHLARNHRLLRKAGISTAILAPEEIPQELRKDLVDEQEFGLDRLILVSNLHWIGDTAMVPHDLGGVLGLEVERNLLHTREQVTKKLLDFGVMLLAALFGFPLMVVISILIRLDSKGPALFRQSRVGKGGQQFRVWKFRTMVENADESLEMHLDENPQLRAEWQTVHKLKHDPRITRIGRFLRKTSLDELPQLINVLHGEMSIVGPRPIMQDEVKLYKDGYKLYTQVQPGITGLWQISGRSDTSYENRVAMDEYYIRHWSTWMDIYILIRTLWVVFKQTGAY